MASHFAVSNTPASLLIDSMRNGAVVRQRLQWLENRVWWTGSVNRSDLILRFNISPPQATNDISLYQKIAPGNLKYDPKRKLYVCADTFSPSFPKDHEAWLKENSSEDSELRSIDVVSVASLKRGIDPSIVQVVSSAARSRTPLRILYQSMKMANPEERIICPHAIVETEVRWHIRAWDEGRRAFLDMIPSRILKASLEPNALWVPLEMDEQWTRVVSIVLVPSKKLSQSQRQIAERDYQMTNGRRTLQTRACMVYYQLSAIHLVDAVRYHKGQPQERDFGIAVENWRELQPLVMEMA